MAAAGSYTKQAGQLHIQRWQAHTTAAPASCAALAVALPQPHRHQNPVAGIMAATS